MTFLSTIQKPDSINYINIGLMLISLAASVVVPFEVFLFAYAILGPLHYLTEISWLHNKNYFIATKWDIGFLVAITTILTIGAIFPKAVINQWTSALLFVSFIFPLFLFTVKKIRQKFLIFFLLFFFFGISGLGKVLGLKIFLLVFLPTLIHVYVFTGLFILAGFIKTKSLSSILSLIVFVLCGVSVFLFDFDFRFISDFSKQTYQPYTVLNISMLNLFGSPNFMNIENVYNSNLGFMCMRFIAFAYLYHYLNWFSKTSVIKWHEISQKRTLGIVFLWLLSISLYIYDYKVGFIALYFLSMLHVLLEFPLNFITIKLFYRS